MNSGFDRNSTPTLDRSQVVRVGDGGARFERRRTAARRRGSSCERDRDARGERVVAAMRVSGISRLPKGSRAVMFALA